MMSLRDDVVERNSKRKDTSSHPGTPAGGSFKKNSATKHTLLLFAWPIKQNCKIFHWHSKDETCVQVHRFC